MGGDCVPASPEVVLLGEEPEVETDGEEGRGVVDLTVFTDGVVTSTSTGAVTGAVPLVGKALEEAFEFSAALGVVVDGSRGTLS